MICPDRVPDPKVTRIDDIVKLGLYDCEVREIAEAMQHNENVRTWHKTNWGKAPQKEIDRLFAYLKIRAYADRCDLVFDDFTCLINGKFLYSLQDGSWKVGNRPHPTWYKSKSPEHFIENYVLKSPFD
jgi:hypothetical protein